MELREVGVFNVPIRFSIDASTCKLDLDHAPALSKPRVASVPETRYLSNFKD